MAHLEQEKEHKQIIFLKKTTKPKKVQLDYSIGDHIVYPSHGVGEVTSIQKYEIAEEKLEMYNVIFEKEKMTLKIPTEKAKEIGIRKVSSKANLKKTLEILNGKAKIRRTMWSRRAQEYESKINSGNLNELTEVVRDLFRNSSQPEQSYSERQLYESARDRLAREVAVVENERETKLEDGGSTDDTTQEPSEQSDVPVQEDKREESNKKELDDLNAHDIEEAIKIIAGSARSMGIEVKE